MQSPPITVAIINHNGLDVLPATVDAIRRVSYEDLRILLVDDGSNDGSPEWIEGRFPEIAICRLARNMTKPSFARNRALEKAQTDYVLLIDNDIALTPSCPQRLVDAMLESTEILCCAPQLVYSDEPDRIYSGGAGLHFLCISSGSQRGRAMNDRLHNAVTETLPGGNVLIDRKRATALGYFDTRYDFGWGEDAELPLRGRLRALRSLHVAGAVAQHVERDRGTARAEAQFYNRYRTLFTIYSARTLLVLGPALIVFEVSLFVGSLMMGVARPHLRALHRTWQNRAEVRQTRKQIQLSRTVPDRRILDARRPTIAGAMAESRLMRLLSEVLGGTSFLYWIVARPLLSSKAPVRE